MEWLTVVAIVIGVVLAIFLKGAFDEKSKKKRLKWLIHDRYGKTPDRDYGDEELSSIPGYFSAHQKKGQIDDITWNDLGMDQLYFRMNHTYSSAGQEYLYYMLRTPEMREGEMETEMLFSAEKELLSSTENEMLSSKGNGAGSSGKTGGRISMEEKIAYFSENEKEREELQYAFMQLGRSGKYSVYDYLEYLDKLGESSSLTAIVIDLLFIPAILTMIASPPFGMLFLFTLISINIYSYMKKKQEIEPYLTSFAYVRRNLDFSKQLVSMDIPVLKEEWKRLKELEGRFGKFRYSAMLGMRGSSMAGDPLSILLDYVNMLLHLDIICFNSMLREVKKHMTDIDRMITITGRAECYIAISSYRASLHQGWCVPCFETNGRMGTCGHLELKGLYHPLLEEAVKNDICVEQGVLLTGSNASGKSTFLKAVAVNALLAQTINTCAADFYQGDRYQIMTSMALRDDLEGGESYYIVEIKSLKRILDVARQHEEDPGTNPVLCFVDEVLRGTNTVERIAASTKILQSLHRPGVLCFAATHDIELTELLAECYDNYHFEEEIEEGDILFNYVLRTGKAVSRNAIRLLGIIGYEEAIIEEAEGLASHFLNTGSWT